jgi:hypothetical protein
LRSFSQNPILGVPTASSLREAHQLRWVVSPPTSIDGFPGGKRPLDPKNSGFEKNFSKGWVPARGPPIHAWDPSSVPTLWMRGICVSFCKGPDQAFGWFPISLEIDFDFVDLWGPPKSTKSMYGFQILVLVPQNRSPELIFVESCSIFQAGAVGNAPGPNFGRKPARNRPKLKFIF